MVGSAQGHPGRRHYPLVAGNGVLDIDDSSQAQGSGVFRSYPVLCGMRLINRTKSHC